MEDSWHGLPPMPGGGYPVRGGVWETDDRRGNLLPGLAEGMSTVQGVWGGASGWIFVRVHDDTTWASGRG